MTDYALLKAKFTRVFANVPEPLREEIIAVIDNNPFSWYAAYGEIEHNTKNSEKILLQLQKIGVL
ncbi:hypothetical protein HZC30_07405 [Candidatus Woesearchaeota archaeon]|nr:hypothetical protein [Candidatus Woesearchaeota archaeon]